MCFLLTAVGSRGADKLGHHFHDGNVIMLSDLATMSGAAGSLLLMLHEIILLLQYFQRKINLQCTVM